MNRDKQNVDMPGDPFFDCHWFGFVRLSWHK
jgi:hypothetical protein